jgi:predicted dehydrogenase
MSGRTIRCGVVGAGAIGLNHIQGFQKHPAARVVAVADTSEERAREACEKFGVPERVADYRELLERDDIPVVSVALPNYLHGPVGLAVVKAGKHLLMDKPFATGAAEAQRIVAAARAKRVVFMVGQNQRFSPVRQTLKRRILRGELGEIYHAEATWLRRSGIPRIGSWFTQKRFAGGGCTYDIGVHMLDLCLHLVGDFDAAAVSGQAFTKFGNRGLGNGGWGKSEIDPKAPFDVDDFAVALIKMKSGRTVVLRTSWAAHQPAGSVDGVTLYGTRAGAATNPPQIFKPGKPDYRIEDVQPGRPLVNPERMAHFLDCVLGKAEPFVKPGESLQVQRILDAIYKSSASGREVRLA